MPGAGQYLGYRSAMGRKLVGGINPYGDGMYSCVFDPAVLALSANLVEVYHIALKGPKGSQFQIYLDTTFYDASPRGDLNSWDPQNPLIMRGGQTLYFHFSSAGVPQPLVTIWLRLPLVGA